MFYKMDLNVKFYVIKIGIPTSLRFMVRIIYVKWKINPLLHIQAVYKIIKYIRISNALIN